MFLITKHSQVKYITNSAHCHSFLPPRLSRPVSPSPIPVPGAPPRKLEVEAINSTAIRVTWKPPLQGKQHGQIRGYQVIFSRLENGEPRGQPYIMDVALPEAQVLGDVLLVFGLSLPPFHCRQLSYVRFPFIFFLHRFRIPLHSLSSHFISSIPGDTHRIFFLSTAVSPRSPPFFHLSPHVTFDSKLVPCSQSFGLVITRSILIL